MKPTLFGRRPDRRADIIPERESEAARRRQLVARVMGSALDPNLKTCCAEGLRVTLAAHETGFAARVVDTHNQTGPYTGTGTTASAALERAVRAWAES